MSVQVHPPGLEAASRQLTGYRVLEQKRREDGDEQALEGLQDVGRELLEASGRVGAGEGENVRVGISVQVGQHGKQDGQDRYDRRDWERERRHVDVDDTGNRSNQYRYRTICRIQEGRGGALHGDGKEREAHLILC